MRCQVFAYLNVGLQAPKTPIFFKVKWSLDISSHMATQSGRNASHELCKELRTSKDLKYPAARLTCPVRQILSRPFISHEKNGGLRYLENRSDIYAKT
jgi:hypothetical protein